MHPLVREAEAAQLRTDRPYFRPGDTVRVAVRIVEGNKERIQNFEGVVIGRKGSGIRETFTVRRVSFNVGMERIFPLHSPRIEDIKVIRRGSVRRAKLYYLRELRGKRARLTERRVDQRKLAAEAASSQQSLLNQVALLEQAAEAQEVQAVEAGAAEPEVKEEEVQQQQEIKAGDQAASEATDEALDQQAEEPNAEEGEKKE